MAVIGPVLANSGTDVLVASIGAAATVAVAAVGAVVSLKTKAIAEHTRRENTEQHGSSANLLDELRREVHHGLRAVREALFHVEAGWEQRAQTIMNALPFPSFEATAAGECEFVNVAWEQATGLTRLAAQGDGWADGVHADDRADVFAAWVAAVRAGGIFGPMRFRYAASPEVWSVTAHPLCRSDGTLVYVGQAVPIAALAPVPDHLTA